MRHIHSKLTQRNKKADPLQNSTTGSTSLDQSLIISPIVKAYTTEVWVPDITVLTTDRKKASSYFRIKDLITVYTTNSNTGHQTWTGKSEVKSFTIIEEKKNTKKPTCL